MNRARPPDRDKETAGPGLSSQPAVSSSLDNSSPESIIARAAARARFRRAKLTFTAAAEAAVRGDSFATEQANDALRELNAARAAQRGLGEEA